MKKLFCDKCKKEMNGVNYGRKWNSFKIDDWSVIVKVGQAPEPHMTNRDVCQDCLIDILKKSKDKGE